MSEPHKSGVGSTGCTPEALAKRQLIRQIKRMRAEVDEAFAYWREQRESCQDGGAIVAPGGFGSGRGRLGGGHGATGGLGISGIGFGISAPVAGRSGRTSRDAQEDQAEAARAASGTNNQVALIDEADIVKHDRRWVYVAANGSLRIIEALKPRVVSTTRFITHIRKLLVYDDRVVVYLAHPRSNRERSGLGHRHGRLTGDGTSTEIVVLDTSNRSAPEIMRRIQISGSLLASRQIGAAVHTVVSDLESAAPGYSTWPAGVGSCQLEEKVARAQFEELKAHHEAVLQRESRAWLPTVWENGQATLLCDQVRATRASEGSLITIFSLDLRDDERPGNALSIRSPPGAVYVSSEALYLAAERQRLSPPSTGSSPHQEPMVEIHKFRIGQQPGNTSHVASGALPGRILDQFSMDEWKGHLRIATSNGRDGHFVSVMAEREGGQLVRVGHIERIAPTEQLRAVRFDGDRGYVVTFKRVDPLFVLDLGEPTAPKILGELKIPGFSTYLHRIAKDHLLSVGYNVSSQGLIGGISLQLFDVSDLARPRLLHKETIGSAGSRSEAASDHLAFNYFEEKQLLAVPAAVCKHRTGRAVLRRSDLHIYDVDLKNGFRLRGRVAHEQSHGHCLGPWSEGSAIKRSVFLDDLVYSIAMDRVKVQRLDRLGRDIADISLLD